MTKLLVLGIFVLSMATKTMMADNSECKTPYFDEKKEFECIVNPQTDDIRFVWYYQKVLNRCIPLSVKANCESAKGVFKERKDCQDKCVKKDEI